MVRSSICNAAAAARRCSTVWTIVSPWPNAVRRSVDWTMLRRAGIVGWSGRSVRRNTIPCPAGAARHTAETELPVCRPTPLTEASRARVRLGTGAPIRHQLLQLVDNGSQPVHGGLSPQELAV